MQVREYETMYRAEEAHWWYVSLRERIERLVGREAARRGSLQILDAGCGTGRLCLSLRRFGPVQGVDVSAEAIERCARRGLSDVRRADLNAADLGTDRYDVVTCIDVLYHRWIESDVAVLRRLQRALRPGGALVVQVPAWPFLRGPHDEAVMTRERYRAPQLRRRLVEAGFLVESLSYRPAALFAPIAVHRLLRRAWPGRRSAPVSDVSLPPLWLNNLLLSITRAEDALFAARARPFGSSLLSLARKVW